MAPVDTEDAFTSSDTWVRVSGKLVTARRIVLTLSSLPIVAALVLVWVLTDLPTAVPVIGAGVGVLAFVWAWWLIGRRVRSYAYCERSDDLLVSSGILFRRLV
ncbi:MAG TPA: hypothetical protein VGP37_06430, partial [Candidatus Nanopelagicales bacterium]|nr:hypothetical protein [Candidatus Nanopelagicales bacterium]